MILKRIPVLKARREPTEEFTGTEDSIGDSYFEGYVNQEIEERRGSVPIAQPRRYSIVASSSIDFAMNAGRNLGKLPMVT
jgi:hypothetical protein